MKTIKHINHTSSKWAFYPLLAGCLVWPFCTTGIEVPWILIVTALLYGALFYTWGKAATHRQGMLKDLWYQAARQTNHNSGETGQFNDKKASDFAIDKLKVDLERLDRIPARATFIFSFKHKEIKYLPE